MKRRSVSRTGPDATRRALVGFCDGCGRVLKPMDYLRCVSCYRELKASRRRYTRAAAEGHLNRALERSKQLAADPLLCHWVPDAIILFGSMLRNDSSPVGDVDLCVVGDEAFRRGIEPYRSLLAWAEATAPSSYSPERWPFYAAHAAHRFIRRHDTLLQLTLRTNFAEIGGGRPFPYRIIWTRAGVDAEVLRRTIEESRPICFEESILERRESVEQVFGRIGT